MENNIDKMISNLQQYSLTHPNLITVLISYLQVKKQNLEKSLNLCTKIIDNINEMSDPEVAELLLMFNLVHANR